MGVIAGNKTDNCPNLLESTFYFDDIDNKQTSKQISGSDEYYIQLKIMSRNWMKLIRNLEAFQGIYQFEGAVRPG